MLCPSPYGAAVCVNTAVKINVLDYNVAVRQRAVRQRTATLGAVRSVNGALRAVFKIKLKQNTSVEAICT